MNSGEIEMNILTQTNEGKIFFSENQVSLIKTLNESGVLLGNLQLSHAGSKESNLDFEKDLRQQFSENNNSNHNEEKNFNHNQGKNRRLKLWEEYKDRFEGVG